MTALLAALYLLVRRAPLRRWPHFAGGWLVAAALSAARAQAKNAATAGVIAGVGKQLPEMPLSERDWIAVSLHLRPGHSGGPLVDDQGRLVGINTMMAGPDVGVAVPVHVVKRFLRDAARGPRLPNSGLSSVVS